MIWFVTLLMVRHEYWAGKFSFSLNKEEPLGKVISIIVVRVMGEKVTGEGRMSERGG